MLEAAVSQRKQDLSVAIQNLAGSTTPSKAVSPGPPCSSVATEKCQPRMV